MKKVIGYISYTHGLDGKIKIVPMVSKNEFEDCIREREIRIDNCNNNLLRINICAFTGKVYLCRIKGVNNIEEAKKITKHEIFIETDRSDDYINPEMLLGYDVFTIKQQNKKYGKVIDFGNYGAGDLIEVRTMQNKSEFYLCKKDSILEIDDDDKKIVIKKNDE